MRAALCIVLLLALVLRVFWASQREALHCDEIIQMRMTEGAQDPGELYARLRDDGHPPLVYVSDFVARKLGAVEPAAFRIVPILAAWLAAVLLTFFLARRRGDRAGLLLALLLAGHGYFLQYAAEIRVYGLFFLVGVLQWIAAARYAEQRTIRRAALWGAAAGLCFLTHYYALYLVGLTGLALLAQRRDVRGLLVAAGVCLLVFAPALPLLRAQLGYDASPWFAPRFALWGVQRIAWVTLGSLGVPLVAWMLMRLLVARRRDGWPPWLAPAIAAGWIAPLVAFGGQWLGVPFQGRYLVPMAGIALVPFAYAIDLFFRGAPQARWLSRPAQGVLLLLIAIGSQQSRTPYWMRAPSPGSAFARLLEERGRDGDLVCALPVFVGVVAHHHRVAGRTVFQPGYPDPDARVRIQELMTRVDEPSLAPLTRQLAQGGRVWFVTNGWYRLEDLGRAARSPYSRAVHPLVADILTTCRATHEQVFREHYSRGAYRFPWTVLLFEPHDR